MPVPSWLRPETPATRWNRSKTRGSSASGIPTPVSRTTSASCPPCRFRETEICPRSVKRLRTIFSHILRSTRTSSLIASQWTTNWRPALSTSERKVLARLEVRPARSVGTLWISCRPASKRAKSRRSLTRLSRRRALRWMGRRAWVSRGSALFAMSSSSGPRMRVSGVRSSWLMLLKNSVFARSSSASSLARTAASSTIRA